LNLRLVRIDRLRETGIFTSFRDEIGEALHMPSTNGRREITARANAKEAETVQQSQKLGSKTKQLSATTDEKRLLRSERVLKGQSRKPGA
jgi:hypothetical protein